MGHLRLRRRKTIRITTGILVSLILGTAIGFTILKNHHVSADATCPCSIFNDASQNPGNYNDGTPLTLGVRFRPDIDGYIVGVKFYKSNVMTTVHKGSLWDASGNLLATGTYSNETASGWQTLLFTSPVAVTANTTYTASYTTTGPYVATGGYFTTTPADNFPITTLASNQYDAAGNQGNGVYSSGDNVYPIQTYNGGNYWADALFIGTNDAVAPEVTSTSPTTSATNIGINPTITAQFNTNLNGTTVNSTNIVVTDDANNSIATTLAFNQSTKSLSITPTAPLALHTTYTVTLIGGNSGIHSLGGLTMSGNVSWQFTTETSSPCPCTAYGNTQSVSATALPSNDSSVTLGEKIMPDENGYISGIRFFKQLESTTTNHTVAVYSTAGALLGTGTTSGETGFGWQTAMLASPLAVTAGQTYIIAYTAPDGKYVYSSDLTADQGNYPIHILQNSSYFKYGANTFPDSKAPANYNYWIDPVFTETSSFVPNFSLLSSQPTNQAYGVDTHKPITLTFTQALDASSVANALHVTSAGGATISGTTSYNTGTGELTFTPSSALSYSTAYTVTVAGTLKDVFGTTIGSSVEPIHFTTGAAATTTLNDGKGGPILVVTNTADKFSGYTTEILRSEGINYFKTADISTLSESLLSGYAYVLLGSTSLTTNQVQLLTSWVNSGGNLVAFKPDKKLAPLLGIIDGGSTLSDGYIKVDTSRAPGAGIVGDTIQYHTSADRYSLSGATTVATLYSDASTATLNPAVTLRTVNKGHAAAFTYDLPQSIALTHQGNPAWINHNANTSDGPIRPDSLFRYSGQTDWVNLAKGYIPQADEQQRLLVNILNDMSASTGPLPHYWYLPHGYKAAIEMTSDDHGTSGGTAAFFNRMSLLGSASCSVQDWTCPRASSLVYVTGGPTAQQASLYTHYNFPIGVHFNTNCQNQTDPQLVTTYIDQLATFAAAYPDVAPQQFSRMHCYVWTGWADVAKMDPSYGIHYDLTYEWYPPNWTNLHTGMLSGSNMVMRFVDNDGTMIDTYNAPTDLDYETDNTSATIDADLANATNSNGFYGIFGTHYDFSNNWQNFLVAAAQTYNIPMISANQALVWKNSQSNSTFTIVSSSDYQVVFKPQVAEGGEGTVALLPTSSSNGELNSLTVDGSPVTYTRSVIKGVTYAIFDASPGTYTATYGQPHAPSSGESPSNTQSTQDTTGYPTIFGNASVDTTASDSESQPADDKDVASGQKSTPATGGSYVDVGGKHASPADKTAPVPVPVVVGAVSAGAVVVGGAGWWIIGGLRRRNSGTDITTHFGP